MHHVGAVEETKGDAGPYAGRSEGLTRRVIFGPAHGSVHQSVALCELEAGGHVDRHFHVFEEGVYVLGGELTAFGEQLVHDDFLFVEAAAAHELRNDGTEPARWLEVSAPLPGARDEAVFDAPGAELETPYRRGHFDLAALPDPAGGIGLAGFDAANVAGGAAKIVIGPDLGASQFNLMVIRYVPGAFIKPHDHAFEEGFLFLEGEIEAQLDDETATLRAGDYCWSGVASMHALTNRSDAPVLWLETQVPQPPPRLQARFIPDWQQLQG
jgi:quercetin dioxygenase-like cupin family protein